MVTADNVLKSLDEQGIEFQVVRLCDGDWELEASELSDDEILSLVKVDEAGHVGQLAICTEACTRYDYEPFSCDASQLQKFINDYEYEMFFDGDVVILCEESRTMTVFHHAGGFAHVKL